ncbi:hypothetical protein PCANC_18086 [Puccinia coronata f. sp. avenae]|uniref:Uncharacterized protein n=1 Tax=Puccinia coronata f. sp. avenae TaxID=200324 RepID=A0A2N5SLK9_9BASI|nr:hypothetical protein PCANC_18086 [Puccinia coronata f. sp. avenae]
MSNNPPPTNPPLHSSAARDSFIEELPPSRVPSVAHSRVGRASVSGSATHSRVPSRNPSIIDHLNGSSLDAGSVNQTDGTRRLEHIFTNVLEGSSGPTLADETFQVSQQHPIPGHPLPSLPPRLPSCVPTTAIRNPPATAPAH